MATFNFNGSKSKTKAFDPTVDILNISNMSAAGVSVKDVSGGVKITDLSTGNSITLTGTSMSLTRLSTVNVVFADGSKLLIGDNSPASFDDFGNNLLGGTGDDLILGLGGNDNITAGAGDDIAKGGTGNDSILGSAGDDKLKGNVGDDTLVGGTGNDTLKGGGGNAREKERVTGGFEQRVGAHERE